MLGRMRRPGPLLLGALLVLPLLWLGWRALSPPALMPGAVPVEQQAPEPGLEPASPPAAPPEARGTSPEEGMREAVDAAPGQPEEGAPPDSWPRSQILGRIVGSSGLPVPGVSVRLYTVGEEWISDPDFKGEVGATLTETDGAGRFGFDVAWPTSSWISLAASNPPFHTLIAMEFGEAGGRNNPPILPGQNDLGDLLMSDAGGIRGRLLLSDSGAPEEARVRLDESLPSGVSLGDRPDEDGFYEIVGIPPGSYPLEVRLEGYLTRRREGVEVRAGEMTEGVDFTLVASEGISGRVVDEQGQPLVGARVEARPVISASSYRVLVAISKEDGVFELFPEWDAPHDLSAELVGFEGIVGTDRRRQEPGDGAVELVLPRSPEGSFRVVDATSGEPVERFGLKVFRVRKPGGSTSSSTHDEPARVEDHPGGVVVLPADPRWDSLTVVAPGYGEKRKMVRWDEGAEGQMTLSLEAAGVLRGRVVVGGEAVSGPIVRLVADRIPRVPDADPALEDDPFSGAWGTDLDPFAGRMRRAAGREDGGFEFAGLAAGTYELTVTSPGRASLTRERLVVTSGGVLDLGDLELPLSSEVHGVVMLPGGSLGGLELLLSTAPESGRGELARLTLSDDGSFRFRGLDAGEYFLHLLPSEGRVTAGASREVNLGVGESREVVFDATDRQPCHLEVTVLLNGVPTAGLRVECSTAGAPSGLEVVTAVTDSTGMAALDAPGAGRGDIRVLGKGPAPLGALDQPVALTAGLSLERTLELEAGQLEVEVPYSSGWVLLWLLPLDAPGQEEQSIYANRVGPGSREGTQFVSPGWLAPGRYRVGIKAPELSEDIEVIAGQVARLRLLP